MFIYLQLAYSLKTKHEEKITVLVCYFIADTKWYYILFNDKNSFHNTAFLPFGYKFGDKIKRRGYFGYF